ncbi:DUF3180 domain-containing protein [Demequina sp. SO4-13]|uniref:DUF3180 domain-containing protein n=1 Tax=Demequina sp. SO4-13 TaxID=3401027 RepID=UPI003AF9E562
MSYLTWQRLTLVGLCSVALAWLVTVVMEGGGATPEPVPWTVFVVCVAAGAFALWMGWQVRRYLKGDKPDLDGMRAARTAVLAQACAYAGAILVGAFLGYALGLADEWSHTPRREVILSALLGALAGAVLLASGAIAEHWCRHGGDDEDRSEPSAA